MKKTLFSLAVISFIFCSYASLKGEAAEQYKCEQIANMESYSGDTCVILTRGYYIYSEERAVPSLDSFHGDIAYKATYTNPNKTIPVSEFKKDPTYDSSLDDQIQDLLILHRDTAGFDCLEDGVVILHVNSYAVYEVKANYTSERVFINGLVSTQITTQVNISGSMTHMIDYNNRLSLENIKSRYKATDNVDLDITNKIEFESNYQEGNSKVGKFFIIAKVADAANNITYAIDYIIVYDHEAPVLNLQEDVKQIEVGTVFTSNDAKAYFTATDNYVQNPYISFTDNYKSNYNTLGEYKITGVASDYGNLSQTKTLTIKVVDTTAPVIGLSAGGNRIVSNHVLETSEILALLSLSDNYDELEIEDILIETNCDGSQGKEFTITASISDYSGNVGISTFSYYITDTVSPIITVEKTLYLMENKHYTNEELIELLKEAGLLGENSIVTNINKTYTGYENKELTYEFSFEEQQHDGTTKSETIKLKIVSPIEPNINNNNETNYNYLYLLFIIPIGICGYFFYLKISKKKRL